MANKPQKKKTNLPDDIDEWVQAVVAKAPPLSHNQIITIRNIMLRSKNEIATKEAAGAGLTDRARQRAEVPEPTDRTRPHHRTHLGGDQIVRVKKYSYLWAGDPLRVGDQVLLPGSEFRPKPWSATVTGIGSAYRGEMKHVLRRLRGVEDTPLAQVVHGLLTGATTNANEHLLEALNRATSWRIGKVHTPGDDGDLVRLRFTLIVTDEHGNQTDTVDTEIKVARSDFYHALAKL